MRTDYLIQSVSEVKQNSNWASWDCFALFFLPAVDLFSSCVSTAESSATTVFPKNFKNRADGCFWPVCPFYVTGSSTHIESVCLYVSASMNRCIP